MKLVLVFVLVCSIISINGAALKEKRQKRTVHLVFGSFLKALVLKEAALNFLQASGNITSIFLPQLAQPRAQTKTAAVAPAMAPATMPPQQQSPPAPEMMTTTDLPQPPPPPPAADPPTPPAMDPPTQMPMESPAPPQAPVDQPAMDATMAGDMQLQPDSTESLPTEQPASEDLGMGPSALENSVGSELADPETPNPETPQPNTPVDGSTDAFSQPIPNSADNFGAFNNLGANNVFGNFQGPPQAARSFMRLADGYEYSNVHNNQLSPNFPYNYPNPNQQFPQYQQQFYGY